MPEATAAPPAPATSAPAAKESLAPVNPHEKAFAELDALDGAPPKPKAEKPPEKPPVEPPKPEVKPPEKPVEKAGDKPVPKEEHIGPTKGLKIAYEALKEKVAKQYEPELQTLKAKVKELEGNGAGQVQEWQQKFESAQKRAQELESEIEFVNFAKSQKFVNEYQKPYQEAWAKAVGDFSQLTIKVQSGTDEFGEPKFATRKAGAEDLLTLANMPLSEMDDAAERMFGKSAPRVIRHVEKIRELSDKQNEALQNAAKNGEERNKTRQAETQAQMQQRGKLWQDFNKTLGERYPKFFSKREGDDEFNSALEKGFQEADRLFSPNGENKPATMEEATHLHALIRNQSAAFKPVARLLKKANDRIAELEKELAEFRSSEPKTDKAGKGAERSSGKSFMQTVEEEIDALERASV